MENIRFQCDRCRKIINGSIDDLPSSGIPPRMTSGFYDVSDGYWSKFARWEEERLCDDCMHSDKEYIKTHGSGI